MTTSSFRVANGSCVEVSSIPGNSLSLVDQEHETTDALNWSFAHPTTLPNDQRFIRPVTRQMASGPFSLTFRSAFRGKGSRVEASATKI